MIASLLSTSGGGGGGGGGGGSQEHAVAIIVSDVLSRLPPNFDIEAVQVGDPGAACLPSKTQNPEPLKPRSTGQHVVLDSGAARLPACLPTCSLAPPLPHTPPPTHLCPVLVHPRTPSAATPQLQP